MPFFFYSTSCQTIKVCFQNIGSVSKEKKYSMKWPHFIVITVMMATFTWSNLCGSHWWLTKFTYDTWITQRVHLWDNKILRYANFHLHGREKSCILSPKGHRNPVYRERSIYLLIVFFISFFFLHKNVSHTHIKRQKSKVIEWKNQNNFSSRNLVQTNMP